MMSVKVGKAVRFGDPHGSWGKVIAIRPGDWRGPSLSVEWNYGKDKKGKAIKSVSNGINEMQLIPITRQELRDYSRFPAWSEEQKAYIRDWNAKFEADHRAGKRRRFA